MFLFPSHSTCVWCGRSRSNLSKGSLWETVMWVGEPTNCGGRPQKFCDPDRLLNFSQLIEVKIFKIGEEQRQVYLPPDGKQHKQVCTINIYSLNANSQLISSATYKAVPNTLSWGIRKDCHCSKCQSTWSNSSALGCHREAPRAAGLKQKHSAHGSLKPSLYFQDRKNTGSLHNGWIPSHKISPWSFLLLSGGGNPKWAPHLAFHGKCVFIIPGQGTKRPLTTGCWLTSAKTHWLHKENGFHFVWWRTQEALGRGWLTRK